MACLQPAVLQQLPHLLYVIARCSTPRGTTCTFRSSSTRARCAIGHFFASANMLPAECDTLLLSNNHSAYPLFVFVCDLIRVWLSCPRLPCLLGVAGLTAVDSLWPFFFFFVTLAGVGPRSAWHGVCVWRREGHTRGRQRRDHSARRAGRRWAQILACSVSCSRCRFCCLASCAIFFTLHRHSGSTHYTQVRAARRASWTSRRTASTGSWAACR